MKTHLVIVLLPLQLLIAANESTSFLFFGDWGTGSSSQYEVASTMKTFCAGEQCEFALLLGDNFYPAGVSSVSDPFFKDRFVRAYHPLGIPFYVALGNHDYGGNIQAQVDYSKTDSKWILPYRFHKFSVKNIDFFAIDTEKFDAEQITWLKSELGKSEAEWKIVFGHHPIYSYGQHGDTKHLVQKLLPILLGRTHFYLCGHDHDFQVIEKNGLKTIVSGTAAQSRPVVQGPQSLFASNKLGFSHFLIKGDKATLKMIGQNSEILYSKIFLKSQFLARPFLQ